MKIYWRKVEYYKIGLYLCNEMETYFTVLKIINLLICNIKVLRFYGKKNGKVPFLFIL